jgi:3-oxoacyl-[acyl-carrier protein] reductase
VSGTLLGPMYSSKAVLEYMVPQKSGRIINVASAAGFTAIPDLVVYGASKAGLVGFTRNLAQEVAKHGIHVLGVAPGIMMPAAPPSGPVQAPSVVESFARTWLGRVSIAEEVANLVAFMASSAASYMTGTTINIDGGITG